MKKRMFKMKKTKIMTSAVHIFLFVLIFFIMKCAPLISDDYIFIVHSTGTIKSALDVALHYGNGRLLGNFFTAFLVHYQTVFNIIRSLIITLLIILIPKLVKSTDETKNLLYTIVSAGLVLGTSAPIFSEVFSWESGFGNYVPPIVLAIICFLLLEREEKSKLTKIISYALIFILGISAQLFVELNTAVVVCFIAVLIVYYFITDKKKLPKACTWFASSIIGGAIMYAVPKMFEHAGLVDVPNYRTIHLHSVRDLLTSIHMNSRDVMRQVQKSEVMLAVIVVLTFVFLKVYKDKWKYSKLFSISYVLTTGASLFLLFNLFLRKYLTFIKFGRINDWVLHAAIAEIFVMIVIAILHMPKCRAKYIFMASVALAVFSVCPMLIVSPFGPRCMLIAYVVMAFAVITLLDYLIKDCSKETIKRIIKGSSLAFAAIAVTLVVIFMDINWVCSLNIKFVEEKMKDKPDKIEVIDLENEYVHLDVDRFHLKHYYYDKEPGDIEFKYLSYSDWCQNRGKEGWFK